MIGKAHPPGEYARVQLPRSVNSTTAMTVPEDTMADGSGQVPVVACIRSAWQFLFQNWRRFVPAAIIVSLIAEIGPAIALVTASSTPQSQSALSANLGEFVMMLPATLASLLLAAAVLRMVVREEFVGVTGLMLGADELRLLGVLAGLLCIIVPFGTLVYFIVSIGVLSRLAATPAELQRLLDDPDALGAALDTALGPAGSFAFLVFMFLALGLAIYVATRLFMINAATIGERKVVMFQTWRWSRGNVLRMLSAILLTWLPSSLIDSVLYGLGVTILNGVVSEQNATIVIPVFRVVTTFAAAMLTMPVIALGGIFYKGLRPVDFVAKS